MKPVIIPTFLGRLGNNLFQVAACIAYAKKYSTDWAIPPHYHHRQIYKYWKLPIYKGNIKALPVYDVATDEGWGYKEIPRQPGSVRIRGFFQSERNFDNAKDEVRAAFPLKNYPDLRNSVSIHIRRGDYVQHADTFPPITTNYVRQAIELLEKESEVHHLAVFSDDLQWAQEHAHEFMFGFKSASFYQGTEFDDLSKMASCGRNIIANSTFSWWAAWLNTNPNKVVISPSHEAPNWFGHNKMDTTHLIPKEWREIKFR